MAKRQFKLTVEEIRQISQREQETREALELRRLQAVRLYGSGEAMGVVEAVSGASRRTILRWASQYECEGLVGLEPGWEGGNHRGLSVSQREAVAAQLGAFSPAEVLGSVGSGAGMAFWTVNSVQQLVKTQYGVTYRSVRSYHYLLEESGLSFQRPEGIYRSRPSDAIIAEFEADAEKK